MNHRDTQPDAQINHRPKWRFRFSLLTFLFLVIGIGTFLGVWVGTIDKIRKQWKAAEPLIDVGVTFETVPSGLPRWMTSFLPAVQTEYIESVDFNRKRITDETMAALTRLPRLERLYLERTYANDDHCVEIAKIKTLRRLALWGTQITDNGAKLFTSLPDLEIVDLTHTDVNWRTELLFQDFPNIKLRSNYLGYVHDADASEIDELKQLKLPVLSLELRDANDADIIKAIDLLPSLESISLLGSSDALTPIGLRKIRDCRRIESVSISHDVLESSHGTSPTILKHVCKIWGPHSKKASIIRSSQSHLSVWLFETDESRTISPEIRLAIHAQRWLPPSYFDGVEGLENVEMLETERFDPLTLRVLPCLPNLKHLSISNVIDVPEEYGDELANIERLESFRLIARLGWNEFSLPDDFFEDWKSRDSMHSILIHHAAVNWQQLRPLLEFPNLERLMITGDVAAPRNFLPDLRKHFGVKENKAPIHPSAAREAFENGH